LVGVGTTDVHLIFARGTSNTLGYHGRDKASLTISLDVPHAPPMPRQPNEIEVVIVTATLTVAAPDYSFGEATLAKLKWRLAAALGVTTSAVTLSIVSSFPYRRLSERDSIDIRAEIHFTNEPAATAAVDKLELFAADPQAASTALGVPITSVAEPLATTTWMTKPPPTLPPSPPAQPAMRANVGTQGLSASDSDTGVMAGIIVGAVCGVLLLGGLYYYRKRRRDAKALPPPPLTPPPAEARPKKKRQRGTVWVNIGMSRGEGKEDAPEDAERTMTMKIGSSSDQKPPPPPCPPPGPPPPEAELPPLPDHDDATVARI
jgi:LPXTG-motif cell wall-anchored protein